MTVKHTEGRWSTDGRTIFSGDTQLATVCHFVPAVERQANAAVMAAGPALLAALETARNGLVWYQEHFPQATDGSDDEAMAEIDDAIAAAAGVRTLVKPAGEWEAVPSGSWRGTWWVTRANPAAEDRVEILRSPAGRPCTFRSRRAAQAAIATMEKSGGAR